MYFNPFPISDLFSNPFLNEKEKKKERKKQVILKARQEWQEKLIYLHHKYKDG